MASTPVITVYGATGYTSQNHLIPYLDEHADAGGFDYIIAGRNREKLDAVAASLPSNGASRRSVAAVALNDQNGVDELVKRSTVIINMAGPYQLHNAVALITSCIKHGKHYLDLTGEIGWLSKVVIKQHDYSASKHGSVIVPMCGFESVPGDMSVYHGLRTLQERYGREVALKESTNFYTIAGGVSGGTMASVAAEVESDLKAPMDEYCLLDVGMRRKAPRPQLIYRAPPTLPGWPTLGAFFVGSVPNLACIRRSWYLSRIPPAVVSMKSNDQFTDDDEPRHALDVNLRESVSSLGPRRIASSFGAAVFSLVCLVFVGLYVSSKIIRNLLKPLIPQPGQGPSMEICRKGSTVVQNVALADKKDVAVLTRYEGKGDPGYYHTSRVIAEAALCLALPPPKGTRLPPLAQVGGVLTPSTAFGMVLVERLRLAGVATITSEIVPLQTSETKKDL